MFELALQDIQGLVRVLRNQRYYQSEQLTVFEVGAVESVECGEDGRGFAATSTEVVGNLGQREAQHSERLGNVDTLAFGQLVQVIYGDWVCQTVVRIGARSLLLQHLLRLLGLVQHLRVERLWLLFGDSADLLRW